MDRLDRKDLKDAGFDVVLRGYDKRQVDERLRFLGAELTAADNALRAASQRAAMLEDALTEARSTPAGEPPGDSNFGARVEKILTLAEEEAREVRNQAEAELSSVRQQLERARHEVERESERVRAQAQADADQSRKAAADEAAELGKAARAEADQLVTLARAEADRLVAAATDAAQQRERSSAHELHQLSRLREEINADLYRAKEVLDSLFGATGAITGAGFGPSVGAIRNRKDDAQPLHQARTV
ncbi:MAG: hypothetical protein WCB57_13520 [Pseudonocardiaceae bacterium]